MRLIIVRHGETVGNANKLSQGHTDFKLTDKGIQQAKKIAERLKDVKIDAVYSSDLSRCADTAKEILRFHPDIKPVFTKELREQAKGIFEGKPNMLISEFLKKKNIEFHDFEPEGGEKYRDIMKRMIEFFGKISKKHADETVLIVGHGSTTACLLVYLLNRPIQDTNILVPRENTAISILDIKNGKIKAECLNCTGHLK
jgi:broad specificity phosphatase PhoE